MILHYALHFHLGLIVELGILVRVELINLDLIDVNVLLVHLVGETGANQLAPLLRVQDRLEFGRRIGVDVTRFRSHKYHNLNTTNHTQRDTPLLP